MVYGILLIVHSIATGTTIGQRVAGTLGFPLPEQGGRRIRRHSLVPSRYLILSQLLSALLPYSFFYFSFLSLAGILFADTFPQLSSITGIINRQRDSFRHT